MRHDHGGSKGAGPLVAPRSPFRIIRQARQGGAGRRGDFTVDFYGGLLNFDIAESEWSVGADGKQLVH